MRALKARSVIEAVADWCDIPPSVVVGPQRTMWPQARRARRLACLILRSDCRSFIETADALGYYNHTSVRYQVTVASDEEVLDAKKIETELRLVAMGALASG